MLQAMRSAKICAIASVPFAIYNTSRGVYDMATTPEKVDGLLRMIEGLGWLGESSSTFVNGLHMIGAVSINAISLGFAFSVTGAFLSSATLVLNAKHLHHGRRLSEELHKLGDDHEGVLKALESKTDYQLHRHFGVAGDKIRTKVQQVLANRQDEAAVKSTVDSLKGRIRSRNFSHALAIVSAAVTIIAMSILLFTPLSTLAYGLLAAAAVVGIIKYFYEHRAVNRLKRDFAL